MIRSYATVSRRKLVGDNDAIATNAQLLAGKRSGFFAPAFGLTLYPVGLTLESPEGKSDAEELPGR